MNIKYNSSVHTQAGWRSVTITAEAVQVSKGMAQVIRVTAIDGEALAGTMSRTGAKRQQFWGHGVAEREIGAKKRLSSCEQI